ncbi:hypothetical protein BD309DRAFT_1037443 [Dichomitus squalens]|nr:hypothetical protein BD309DRAFT_1037443 [Dichomitus squalens]
MADNSAVQAISENLYVELSAIAPRPYGVAFAALFIYDFILTLDSELMLFWTVGHLSGATILFLLNRYITLTWQIINIIPLPSSVEVASEVSPLPTSVITLLEEPYVHDASRLQILTDTPFYVSLTSILTSRFLINLQKAQRKMAGSSQSVSLGELAFQAQTSGNTSRFIGSLGVQLSFYEDVGEGENEVEVAS